MIKKQWIETVEEWQKREAAAWKEHGEMYGKENTDAIRKGLEKRSGKPSYPKGY